MLKVRRDPSVPSDSTAHRRLNRDFRVDTVSETVALPHHRPPRRQPGDAAHVRFLKALVPCMIDWAKVGGGGLWEVYSWVPRSWACALPVPPPPCAARTTGGAPPDHGSTSVGPTRKAPRQPQRPSSRALKKCAIVDMCDSLLLLDLNGARVTIATHSQNGMFSHPSPLPDDAQDGLRALDP